MGIEILKKILNSDFSDNKLTNLFELLKSELAFDEAYIVFFNPNSITVKYAYPYDEKVIESVIDIEEKYMKNLFSPKNNNFEELKSVLDSNKNYKSYLVSNLTVQNIIFGAVILFSKNDNNFDEKREFVDVVSSALAYKIKDKELSEIFKIQLSTVKENFIKSKNDYKTIKEENSKIIESDKIKSEFLANITHELRTPLNAIIGFSEMLNSKILGELNSKQEEYIGDIYVSGVHLLGMINEILDVSKIESNAMTINKTEFDISRAVDEVANIMLPLALKKEITLTKKVNDCRICADFQKIKQILYNLVSNAIKFTNNLGKIDISVDFDKKYLYINVKDTGIGIAQENQEKIFEKFVQLENSYTKTESSTGLGLTISKEFVKMHNGEIALESELGKGTTFKVKLPLK